MLEVIFTLDYEIYGNGRGSLQDLIYTPAEKLEEIFKGHNVPFVAFIEVAELEELPSSKNSCASLELRVLNSAFICIRSGTMHALAVGDGSLIFASTTFLGFRRTESIRLSGVLLII
jgi:hypothetical protein